MINLLPPISKEQLKKEKTFHLVLILGALVVLFFVSISLLLLSIRIYVAGQIQIQEILVESQKAEDEGSPFVKIRSLNSDIRGLDAFYRNQVVFSDIIVRISSAAPEKIYLTSFDYTPVSRGSGRGATEVNARISLTGFAPTTEDLLMFREGLEEDSMFESFNFPSSNWNLENDINFSFDFEVNSSEI